ncbi:hypothetical protein QOZ80_9BG0710620 [Eleusine coracana subsp. coracana]|nr:hypothetical protein QOZ80_9BG0710620 [Eleusine coracana subsp. coracana]
MQIIFGSGQATGRFAMGSNEAFSIPSNHAQATADDEEGGMKSQPINLDGGDGESSKTGATSKSDDTSKEGDDKGKATMNNLKRKRTCQDEYLVMLGMTEVVTKVATALEKPQHNEVHPELYDSVINVFLNAKR